MSDCYLEGWGTLEEICVDFDSRLFELEKLMERQESEVDSLNQSNRELVDLVTAQGDMLKALMAAISTGDQLTSRRMETSLSRRITGRDTARPA